MIMLPAALLPALHVSALSPGHYAANSAMSTGRWAKVKISGAGMNIITDTQLRNLGFTNPEAVHVYGMGGRQINYGLTDSDPDDLPLVASVRTSKGIVFFATDNFTWKASSTNGIPYTHSIHAYSDDTYYFVSDIPLEETEMRAALTSPGLAEVNATTFTERIVHENELEPAGESGSQIYGEDFRSKKSQTFSFTLPGMADKSANVNVRFAAKTTSGTSSLLFTANGNRLDATTSDIITSSDADSYCRVITTRKDVENVDGKLDLTIDYSYTGALFKANLDYIEVFYNRHLELDKGELYFYVNVRSREGLTISGCSDKTVIWDITDPTYPRKVEYQLQGDKASFISKTTGYREFVAFDPESVSRQVTPSGVMANQDIHGMDTPDMLIITYPEYRQGAEKLAAFHTSHDGMRVAVLEPDAIYNEFSGGKPDFLAFRRLLKMWYDRGDSGDGHKISYCLIMGKPLYDNKMVSAEAKGAGFKPMPIWQSYDGLSEKMSYSNDDIIGMLDDVTDSRFSMTAAMLTIPVGRFPVTTSQEAVEMAEKVEKYAGNPDYGPWRNKVMIIADDSDRAQHIDQAQNVYGYLRSAGNGASFLYDRLYLDSYPLVMTGIGPTYPQATERMLRNYNDGVIFTDYIGHASAYGWGHEHLWDWESITSMTNKNLTFMYAATCGFTYWDLPTRSGAEYLLLNPESGIIGMMGATRTVYISQNGDLNYCTTSEFFARDADGGPRTFGDVYIAGKNNYVKKYSSTDSNKLRYAFLGDPAIRIPSARYNVAITNINGQAITNSLQPESYPELAPMSAVTVEGCITDAKGNVLSDFNGTVNLQLYDAERVITTYGNGDSGVVRSYNDHDSRLAVANATVTGGRWTATLRVPPEIRGTYNTALISSYAWSDRGDEANGAFEKLYVFGYAGASADTTGPEIEAFYVNNPSMPADAVIGPNPVVFARLRDESGINISQSGIGHSLNISVDGKEFFNDLSSYFEQDANDPDFGTLVYPLTGIAAGKHTLTLTAWDNANNVSKASIDINIGAATDPVIYEITASHNSETSSVDFRILLDRPNTSMTCTLGIYDLMGRKIWDNSQQLDSDLDSVITTRWDLCDSGGNRVPRGIYIYRATVESPEGTYSSKSKKIAVAAE